MRCGLAALITRVEEMTFEKICPILSRPAPMIHGGNCDSGFDYFFMPVPCIKEKCLAWKAEETKMPSNGFCKLIEGAK
jgi:hypothetical protein